MEERKNHNSNIGGKRWMASVIFAVLNIAALVAFAWILKMGFEPLVGNAATGIYKALNFRGTLKNSDSSSVSDGSFSFYFSIYDASTGGNCLYAARGTCGTPTAKSIAVTSGVFSTLIGDTDNGDNAITIDFNSDTYWLGVKVGTDAELTPRVRIGASGYAFNADLLDGLNTSSNGGTTSFVPVTNSYGQLMLSGLPQTSFVSSSTLYVNPASATSTYPLLGLAVGGTEKFKVDASGNVAASGTIYAAGSGTSTFVGGLSAAVLNITSTSATSTFANGIQLSGGCFLTPGGLCVGADNANQALSNLSAVAINTSLLPGTANNIDLGSYAKTWRDVYASGTIYGSIATSTFYGSLATSTWYGNITTSTWYASVATTTLDGVAIGGSTAAAGTFTTITANTGFTSTAGLNTLGKTSSTQLSVYEYLWVGTTATTTISGRSTSTFPYGATFATTGGNVGIGTTSPAYTLDVNGTIQATDIISTGPWVDVRSYSSLSAAITAIGSTDKTLLIPTSITLTANVIVPSNVALYFLNSGQITLGNYNLTINGTLQAPTLKKIFNYSGTGKVTLASGAAKDVYPQWWGAIADDDEDDFTAVSSTIAAISNGTKSRVYFPVAGAYRLSEKVVLPDPIWIDAVPGVILRGITPGMQYVLGMPVAAAGFNQDIRISNITIDAFSKATNGLYIKNANFQYFRALDGILVYGAVGDGIVIDSSTGGAFYNLQAESNGGNGISSRGNNGSKWYGITTRNNALSGLDITDPPFSGGTAYFGVLSETNTLDGIYVHVSASSTRVTISGGWIEDNGRDGVRLTNGGANIEGLRIDKATTTPTSYAVNITAGGGNYITGNLFIRWGCSATQSDYARVRDGSGKNTNVIGPNYTAGCADEDPQFANYADYNFIRDLTFNRNILATSTTSTAIGIGTGSPNGAMHIVRETGDQTFLRLQNNGSATGDTAKIKFDTSGSVLSQGAEIVAERTSDAFTNLYFRTANASGILTDRLHFYTSGTSTLSGFLNVNGNGTSTISYGTTFATSGGNVGIGTADPNALLTLQKNNSGGLGSSLRLINIGTAASSEVSIEAQITSNQLIISKIGFTRTNRAIAGDSDIYFSTVSNGSTTERMRILDNGYIGIGTTNPSDILTVAGGNFVIGNGAVTSTFSNTQLSIGTTAATSTLTVYSSSGPWLTIGNGTASTTIGGYSATATSTNPYGIVLATSGGNVGIGTATPGSKLSVSGHTSVDGGQLSLTGVSANGLNVAGLTMWGGTAGGGLYARGDVSGGNDNFDITAYDDILFSTVVGGSFERMRIKGSTGNVGIGTTSPNVKLEVAGNVSSTMLSTYQGLFVGTTATTSIYGTATSTFGAGVETTVLNITSNSATSTFANGIDLSKGCYSINGTCVVTASGAANQALSNLSSVAVNASLVPGANNSIDLGSSAFAWRSAYVSSSIIIGAGGTASTTLSGNSTSSFAYGVTFATGGGGVGIGTSTVDGRLSVIGTISNPISTNSGIKQVGSIGIVAGLNKIFVSGRYAYVTNYGSNLYILDVLYPQQPAQISSLTFSKPSGCGGGSVYNEGVYVSGRYAYIVSTDGDSNCGILRIVDISNPKSPTLIATLNRGTSTGSKGIFVSGHYAYIANYNADTISVVDISNPYTPVQIATAAVGDGPMNIKVSGRYAYVTNYAGNTFSVVNISNPASPSQVGTMTPSGFGWPSGLAISGNYAYISDTLRGYIYIVDISNPTAPVEKARLTTSATANTIAVAGRYAYIGQLSNLEVADVASSTRPAVISTVSITSNTYDIAISGRYAYTTHYNAGEMRIIDISGTETSSLMAHSAEVGNLQSKTDIIAQGNITAQTGLSVGAGGIYSDGALAVAASSTPSSFGGKLGIGTVAPSSTLEVLRSSGGLAEFGNGTATTSIYSNDIVVSGQSVCLANGTNCPSTAAGWTDGGAEIYLQTSSDNVTIGGTGNLAKLTVLGDADEKQFVIKANATQNANIFEIQNSSNVPLAWINSSGGFGSSGTIYASGNGTSTFSYGTTFATLGGNVVIGDSGGGDELSKFKVVGSAAIGGGTTNATGTYAFATGNSSLAGGAAAVALGHQNNAMGAYSTALGINANAYGEGSIAIGPITVGGNYSMGIGLGNTSNGTINGTNILSITESSRLAKVGINTTAPSSTLAVVAASPSIELGTGMATTTLYGNTTSTFPYGLALATLGGNVGIGTNAPRATIEISGGNSAYNSELGNFIISNSPNSNRKLTQGIDLNLGTYGSAFIQTTFNGIPALPLLLQAAGGNVGIATTTPWRTLSVAGTVAFDGLTAAGAGNTALCLASNKEVTAAAGDTCSVSSERFKYNIENLSSGLDIVRQLRPVSFLYKSNDEPNVGFIAEEVAQIDSRLVFIDKNNLPYTVKYQNLTSYLAKAIQELSDEMDNLKASSTTLSVANDPSNIGPITSSSTLVDFGGKNLINIASLSGIENKWVIDENGDFATSGEIVKKIATSQGEKKFYPAYNSDPTIMLTGSGELINGEARIIFAPELSEIIEPAVPIKTSVTLTSEGAQGLYVAEKSVGDILVKEINQGRGSARFDYIIVAMRKMSGGGGTSNLAYQASSTPVASDPNFPNSLTPSAATSTTPSAIAAASSTSAPSGDTGTTVANDSTATSTPSAIVATDINSTTSTEPITQETATSTPVAIEEVPSAAIKL